MEIRLSPAAEQLLETAVPGGADAVNRLHSASAEGDDHRALITWSGPTGNQACGTEAADPPADSRFGDSEMSADLAELQRSVSLHQGEKGIRVPIDRFIAVATRPHRLRPSVHQHRDLPFHPAHDVATSACGDFRPVRRSPAARLRLDASPAHPPGLTSDGRRLLWCPRRHFSSSPSFSFPAPIRFSNAGSRPCALDTVAPHGGDHTGKSHGQGNRGRRVQQGRGEAPARDDVELPPPCAPGCRPPGAPRGSASGSGDQNCMSGCAARNRRTAALACSWRCRK